MKPFVATVIQWRHNKDCKEDMAEAPSGIAQEKEAVEADVKMDWNHILAVHRTATAQESEDTEQGGVVLDRAGELHQLHPSGRTQMQ